VLRIPLSKQTRPIIDAIKSVIEEVSPELVADVMVRGIVVTGGGALIGGIDHLIKQETKILTTVPENALTAVVEGAGLVLSSLNQYQDVLLTHNGA